MRHSESTNTKLNFDSLHGLIAAIARQHRPWRVLGIIDDSEAVMMHLLPSVIDYAQQQTRGTQTRETVAEPQTRDVARDQSVAFAGTVGFQI